MLKISKGDFEVFLKVVIMVAVIVGAAFLIYLLWLLRSVLILFLISMVLVFLLRPAVDWLSNGKVKLGGRKAFKLRIPRILSIFIVIICVFVIIFFIAVPAITTMIDQANNLFDSVTNGQTNLKSVLDSVSGWIKDTFRVNNQQVQSYLSSLQTNIEDFFYTAIKSLPGILQNIFTTFAGYLFNTFIILIITIFFLLDWQKINQVLFSLLPQKTAETAKGLLGAVYKQIWDYIKAQATLSFMIGTLIGVLCLLLDIKAFLIVGIIVALGEMVPYVGPLISFSLGLLLVLITAVTKSNYSLVLWYAGGFLVIEQILAQAIAAPLIAKKANTHPLLVILVMFSFTTLFSPYAVLLAVPFLVFAKAIIGYLVGEQKVLEKLGIALEPSAPPLSPLITRLRKPTSTKDPTK